jgi:hypothetical protein
LYCSVGQFENEHVAVDRPAGFGQAEEAAERMPAGGVKGFGLLPVAEPKFYPVVELGVRRSGLRPEGGDKVEVFADGPGGDREIAADVAGLGQ